MTRFVRSIPLAIDRITGEVYESSKVFCDPKTTNDFRRLYHEDEIFPVCRECGQDLEVSKSKYERGHFKHKKASNPCIFYDAKISQTDYSIYSQIIVSKESDRHIHLKNKIGNLLKKVPGVNLETLFIDNRFIYGKSGKRRPDVYCEYLDKKLVFEIQLSQLSLSYILSRYNFYRDNGIYLIWILDDFNIHNQGTLEKDIKYLVRFENFFKLDEKSSNFSLLCDYKNIYLGQDFRVSSRWIQDTVPLDKLKFDEESYQVYFYDYGIEKQKAEQRRDLILEAKAEEDRKEKEKRKLEFAKKVAKSIIEEISLIRKRGGQHYQRISDQIFLLNDHDRKILNEMLALKDKFKINQSPLVSWIENAKTNDQDFINFLLNTGGLEIDVNSKGKSGQSAFQAILNNSELPYYVPTLNLLEAGYDISVEDIEFLKSYSRKNKKQRDNLICFYIIGKRLFDRKYSREVIRYNKPIFFIESVKQNRLIGTDYKPNQWVQFLNNALEYYSEYWEYIEHALKYYGKFDSILEQDVKGSFQAKYERHWRKNIKQNLAFKDVFNDLYPELNKIVIIHVYD